VSIHDTSYTELHGGATEEHGARSAYPMILKPSIATDEPISFLSLKTKTGKK
jgi:hypothetical protein